jgi:hypothetical protein
VLQRCSANIRIANRPAECSRARWISAAVAGAITSGCGSGDHGRRERGERQVGGTEYIAAQECPPVTQPLGDEVELGPHRPLVVHFDLRPNPERAAYALGRERPGQPQQAALPARNASVVKALKLRASLGCSNMCT